jgi:hypothetical protein
MCDVVGSSTFAFTNGSHIVPPYALEKKAVLAEAQMMNTIEYRVDCQLLQHLHWDNNLVGRCTLTPMTHS